MSTKKAYRVGYIATRDHPALKLIPEKMTVAEREVVFSPLFVGSPEISALKYDSMLFIPPYPASDLEEIWKKHGKVSWLHCFSAGIDSLVPFFQSQNLSKDKNFAVSNGKSAFSSSLAEYSLAVMLHFNKQVPRLMRNKAEKSWDKFTMNTLTGKKVAFIGFGHIAQTTAKLLQSSFQVEMDVLKRTKCSPEEFKSVKVNKVFGFNDNDRFEVFKQADFVICSLPGTKETFNYVGIEEFKAMKKSAVFISIGRGVAVDEAALKDALTNGLIKGAGLDVFHEEPLLKDSALWTAPNLLISPHNADYTEDYFQLGWEVFYKNLTKYLTEGSLETQVNIDLGY